MAQVIVTVNARSYMMQCPDGEEGHLRELAQALDAEVAGIRQNVGAVGDVRLLVMAGLVIADRLSDAMRRVEDLEGEIRALRDSRITAVQAMREIEAKLAERVNAAAQRFESMAQGLETGEAK